MDLPFELTLEHVVTSCRKAYEEKRLCAQNGKGCVYFSNGFGCAIGVALPKEMKGVLRKKRLLSKPLDDLRRAGVVKTDRRDWMPMNRLQIRHDSWAQHEINAESRFLSQLEDAEALVEARREG